MRWIALFFSSSAFLGFLPGKITGKPGVGGGLVGSLIALGIQIWLAFINNGCYWNVIIFYAVFGLGLAVIDPAENLIYEKWGPRRRHAGEIISSDYNETNIDEIQGQLLAGQIVLCISELVLWEKIALFFVSFLLFRVFDVLKPWPIKKVELWAQRMSSFDSLFVLLDDTVAGIYAGLSVIILLIILIIT